MDLKSLLALRKQNHERPHPDNKPMLPSIRKSMPVKVPRNTPCPVPVANLPAESLAKARERLQFVLMVRSFSASQRISLHAASDLVRNRYMDNFPRLAAGGKHGVCTATYNSYRNWSPCVPGNYQTKQEAEVLQRLADGYNRGRRPPAGPADFYRYLCAVWLSSHRLPQTQAYDIAVKRLRKDDASLIPPTINQAKYYLSRIDKAIVCIGRDGGTAFKNMFMDYIDRDWSAILPGDMVVGDSRTFDTRCRIWNESDQKWIAVRPTICALLDAASNYFASWTITPDPVDANSISNTLALYCHAYGIPPKYAYFDNGKDYTARGFSTPLVVAGQEFSIFQDLGITMTNSIAYNARAKTVEREFANMMRGFDKTMPDYLGSKPDQRTMDAAWYDAHPEDLPSLAQFIEAFTAWLKDFHRQPQKSIILQNRCPQEVWEERPQYAPWSNDAMYKAFQRPLGLRKVIRGPGVQVAGRRYIGDGLSVTDNVLVKLDPVSDDRVHCYKTDGSFICTAELRESIPALATEEAERDALANLLARQRRQMKLALTALQDLTGGLHLVSPYELLNAPKDSSLAKMGSVGSVKGLEHRYDKYRLENQQTEVLQQRPPKDPADGDKELQRLINEARHDFDDHPMENIQTSIRLQPEDTEEDAPKVNLRAYKEEE